MKNPERAIISILMGIAAAFLYLALSACTSPSVVQDRPVRVAVPVPAPCTSTRPAQVPSLKATYTDDEWQALDARQKASAVAETAVRLRTYAEQLFAATAACN